MMEVCSTGCNLRPVTCELGVLSRPDGSASVQHGLTAVIAGVYGPVEVHPSRELIHRAAVEAVFQPKVKQAGPEGRAVEKIISSVCESAVITTMHPHTAFTVVIQEVQNDGSLIACSLNAACAALLDACAPMQCTFAAVSCAIDGEGNITLDPTTKRETDSVSTHTFVFESRTLAVISCLSKGPTSQETYKMCLKEARDASKPIFDLYRAKYSRAER